MRACLGKENLFLGAEAKLFALAGKAERYSYCLYWNRLPALPAFIVSAAENAGLPISLVISAKCSVFSRFILKTTFLKKAMFSSPAAPQLLDSQKIGERMNSINYCSWGPLSFLIPRQIIFLKDQESKQVRWDPVDVSVMLTQSHRLFESI